MNYLKGAELIVTRKSCDLQELVDGIADDWSFTVQLPTQRGGDMVGEILHNLHVDVHTHPCGDGDEQGVGGHDGGVGAASDTDTRFSIKG